MKIFAIVSALSISGCASTASVFTTDYTDLKTAGIFQYGNFCGPKIPKNQMVLAPEQRISYLNSIHPVDTVDMSCAAHDKCYAEFGEDLSYCDAMLIELLMPWTPYSENSKPSSNTIYTKAVLQESMANASALQFTSRPNPDVKRERTCRYLTNEMVIPFSARMKKTRKHPAEGSPIDLRVKQIQEKTEGLAAGLSKGIVTVLGGGITFLKGQGFRSFSPVEGTCIANSVSTQDRLSRGLSMYRLAAINGGCSPEEISEGSMDKNTCGSLISIDDASRLNFEDMVGSSGYRSFVQKPSK